MRRNLAGLVRHSLRLLLIQVDLGPIDHQRFDGKIDNEQCWLIWELNSWYSMAQVSVQLMRPLDIHVRALERIKSWQVFHSPVIIYLISLKIIDAFYDYVVIINITIGRAKTSHDGTNLREAKC